MKKVVLLLIVFLNFIFLSAQIYEPEGLNMPGSWDNWNNPPTKLVFASASQVSGGKVHRIADLAQPVYQTVFNTLSQGGDVAAGTYGFLFTSGPATSPWNNKWTDVRVQLNTVQTYTWHNDGGGGNDTITLNADKWYVMNFKDLGYTNTQAVFMELSSRPAFIDSVVFTPDYPIDSDTVMVKVYPDTVLPAEQKIYLRYTVDGWNTSSIVLCHNAGSYYLGKIPPYPAGTEVNFYVMTTVMDNPSSDFDLITISFDNNSGQNYQYTVKAAPGWVYETGAVYSIPVLPTEAEGVTIYFNATLGNGALANDTSDIYAHTGVVTNKSPQDNYWLHIVSEWGQNLPKTKFTRIGPNLYKLTIPNIRDYYGITDTSEHVKRIAMVIRSAQPISPDNPDEYIVAREADGSDFFLPVYQTNDLAVKITSPNKLHFLYGSEDDIGVCAFGLNGDSLQIVIDDSLIASTTVDSLLAVVSGADIGEGNHIAVARVFGQGHIATDTARFVVMGPPPVANLPAGMHNGINYLNDTSVVLVLWDPPAKKNYAFVIGDFNNWQADEKYYMNRTPDGQHFWLRIDGLKPGKEYAYQYFIDGTLRIADPYAHKILDPWNDQYIPEYNYPNLKPYPTGKTTGIVSVLQTAQEPYQWQISDFTPSSLNEKQPNLTVYELLVRDFVRSSAIKDVEKRLDYLKDLGIDAIEIMPLNEFEGNISWGYNPDFYFATDKYYGTEQDVKHFIDEAHKRGIAIILDIALNHAFGQCPLVQMYWDKHSNRPAPDNPWFNQVAPHPLSPGYDFNHESPYTKQFVKDVLKYWLTEFKVDGFRFDLSKGFTQRQSSDLASWSAYDQSRIDILKEYYDFIKSIKPDAYVVLEHLADNSEEKVLADYGFLLWQNMNTEFAQTLMGWSDNSDYSWAYYANRGFTYPNNLVYMESHDEERLMYKALQYGNSTAAYSVRDTTTALKRDGALATLFFSIPGPKMMWQFGELGYDYGINYCENGTYSEDCRTSPKPVRWDYFYHDTSRLALYNIYRKMINWRHTSSIFRKGNFTYNLSGLVKEQWISSDTFNVYEVANFDVVSQDVNLNFQHTGTWYDVLTGQATNVSSTPMSKTLSPGEYHVFADKQVTLVPDISTFVNNNDEGFVKIYPNPVSNRIFVKGFENARVRIYSLNGILLKDCNVNDGKGVDVSTLQEGIYLLQVITGNKVYSEKIIKQ